MRVGAGEWPEAKGAAGLLAAAENPEGGSVTTKLGGEDQLPEVAL